MTRDEITSCLTLLKVAYPTFARKMTKRDANAMIALWEATFSEYPAKIVTLAVTQLIQEKKDFAPDIATIKERITENERIATGEPTVDELWLLLKKAMSNGGYCAVEEFRKLPPVLQRYVGSPSELHNMAMQDETVTDSVTRGIFYKNIDRTIRQERQAQALSPEVRQFILSQKGRMALDSEKGLLPEEMNERRNKILNALEASKGENNNGNF